MIIKNDIYFVIFTVLEFVGSLILLNDIMASPLWKRQQTTEDNYLPQQEQNELGCSVFRRIDLRDEIGL